MPDLPVDRLGPYPLLQFAAALLVIGGLALAVYRGTRDRRASGVQIPDEQRWFFDGPVATAINVLRDIKNHQSRLVELNNDMPEECRKQTELLKEIRGVLERLANRRR